MQGKRNEMHAPGQARRQQPAVPALVGVGHFGAVLAFFEDKAGTARHALPAGLAVSAVQAACGFGAGGLKGEPLVQLLEGEPRFPAR